MSRARELAKLGGSGQQVIAGVSSHVGISTFAANVFMYQDLSVSGNINVTGDLSYDEVSARNQFTSGITTTADLIVTGNANFSGIITAAKGVAGNINATGVSTATFLQATTVNASGIVTASTFSGSGASLTGVPVSTGISGLGANVATFLATPTSANLISVVSDETGSGGLVFDTSPTLVNPTVTGSVQGNINATGISTATTLSGTTATFTNITVNGGLTGAVNNAGVGTVAFLQATTVNVGSAATVGGDLTVTGNLTVNGTTTNINSVNLVIEDKNIILADVATPTDVTADGGGITLKGATDKTFNWVSANNSWTSSEDISVATGKQYEINGTSVLSSTALGSSVVSSSLTSVGTLGNLTVSGGITGAVNNAGVGTVAYLRATNVNATGIVTATTFSGSLANTLTLNTSGTGLSGSTSFNNSGAATFTVTSNATNANTASAIVARDASGNFSAGTISAALTGNVSGSSGSCTGNAATVTTNANLTGHVTSVGNAAVLGSFTSAQLATALTDETGSGANVFATSPTLVTPALGTPSSGTLTNCTFPTLNQNTTGNAATVTTNANLTGHVTSVGNAAVLGSFTSAQLATALTDETGSGANVFATSPTLVTPALGTPSSGNLTNCTFPTLNQNTTGNAATVTTNANLTGHVTSVGNAAVLGSFTSAQLATALTDETGSGANVFATSPTLVTPALGTPSSGTLTNCTFPTLNQNTTGSSASCSGNAATATNVAYSGLTGTVPTWNQNTTGSSASCTGNAATATNVAYSGLTGTVPTWNQNTTGTASNITAYTINQSVGTANGPTFAGLTLTSHLQPNANNTLDCGSSAARWRNVYSNDLDLSNEGKGNSVDGTWGSYLIQEGEESLYIINRRSGKKFRFVLEELV